MKRIAIVGASYLQLPIILKAKEKGIETHCFAWEEGAVCKSHADYFYPISILEKTEILKVCKEIKIDGITSIASDVAVPTISYVAENLNLIGNSYESSIICTDKFKMREVLRNGDVKCPFFINSNDLKETNLQQFPFPVIVKPTDRSGSRGVSVVEETKYLEKAISNAKEQSFSKNVIIEEYIEGVEVSVESVSWEGSHHVLSITDKTTTGSPHFVELAHHQPSMLPQNIQNLLKKETVKALNALEIKYGASHSEFRINKAGDIFIIEVGARMGGDFIGSHLVQLSTGYDFLGSVIDISLGSFTYPALSAVGYSGVYFLCNETKKLLPFFNNCNEFDIVKEIQDSSLKVARNSSDRSGFLIYKAKEKINLV